MGCWPVLKVCLLHRQGTQLSILALQMCGVGASKTYWQESLMSYLSRGDRKQDVHGGRRSPGCSARFMVRLIINVCLKAFLKPSEHLLLSVLRRLYLISLA